ncbi:MAG: hypothetical protein BWK78_02115 [Thiotrichaceae bacterium IS1]|nr:MAG: hypothetical protein BWK78_02115 [Thiotrichaceae bacterium IS1]
MNNGGQIELSVNEDGIGTLTGYFFEPNSVNIMVSLDVERTVVPIDRVGNEIASTLELKADQEISIWLDIKAPNQLGEKSMFNVSEHNFIRSCQRGEALPDDIDDFIDDWHDHDYAMELHEFLGMSWEEYRGWVANPNTLPQIIEVHYNIKVATLATQKIAPNQSMSAQVNDWLQPQLPNRYFGSPYKLIEALKSGKVS